MANWTGNAYVDALLLGEKWDTNDLTYYLKGSWNGTETAAMDAVLQSWAGVANISFTRVFTESAADLVEDLTFDFSQGSLGAHSVHNDYTTATIQTNSSQLNGVYNFFGYGWDEFSSNGGLQVGGLGYLTIVHEIGHALGLDHTHDDGGGNVNFFPGVSSTSDSGNHLLNQDVYSVMSYVHGLTSKPISGRANGDNHGFVAGPMAFDIASIQYLYGANLTQNNGDNTYILPSSNSAGTYFSAIWDTGGVDEVVYYGSDIAIIDLNSATLADEDGGGGFISQLATGIRGGYVISGDFTNALADVNGETGVIIENASGGSGGDYLTGNRVANVLNGNDGADTIVGGAGNDTIVGGDGNDTIDGGDDIDTIGFGLELGNVTVDLAITTAQNTGAAGTDTITNVENIDGAFGNDVLSGNASDNRLYGNLGNDVLDGRGGADDILGGAGDDILIGSLDGENDILDGGGDIDTADYSAATQGITADFTAVGIYDLVSSGEIGTDRLVNIERLVGGSGDDVITGDDNDNIFAGGGGNDTLVGGGGTDTIDFSDALGGVILTLDNSGNGTATAAGIGTDTFSGFENIISGSGDDELRGNAQANSLTGGAGSDVLFGNGGADSLAGGAGNDFIWADNQDVELSGGSGGDYLIFSDAVDRNIAIGDAGFETVIGNSGVDVIDASGSDSFMVMWGGASGDTLTLGDGNGYIYGQDGDDTIYGGLNGINTLIGGAGADTIQGGNNIDVMWVDGQDTFNGGGGTGDWAIIASSAGDSINVANRGVEVAAGGVGNDVIDARGDDFGLVMWGNIGADNFYAGSGTDHFYGGGGDGSQDVFHFDNNSNLNIIWDWENSYDRIDLSGAGIISSAQISISSSGTFASVTYGANQILVQNAVGLIDADDFTFA